MNPIYLGDGVYATFNQNMIELRLEEHTAPPVVYLEPETFMKLVRYGIEAFSIVVAEDPK